MNHPFPKTEEALRRLGLGSNLAGEGQSLIIEGDFRVVSDPAIASAKGNVDGYILRPEGGHIGLHHPAKVPDFLRRTA